MGTIHACTQGTLLHTCDMCSVVLTGCRGQCSNRVTLAAHLSCKLVCRHGSSSCWEDRPVSLAKQGNKQQQQQQQPMSKTCVRLTEKNCC
jgi:hypothetical protein